MNNEYVRYVDSREQYRHGCEDCIHASVYEKLKENNNTEMGIRSYKNLMCKFEECPYKDILDKYDSYIFYIVDHKSIFYTSKEERENKNEYII